MVVENQPDFWLKWLFYIGVEDKKYYVGSFYIFLFVVLILLAFGIFIGFLRNLLTGAGSPGVALARTFVGFGKSLDEIFRFSFKRTWAIAEITIKESIRGWVVVTFGVFVIILLLGAWFLDVKSDHPARLYLTAVLASSYWLVLILAVLLPVLTIPKDIEDRTITTVVTKPVYSIEIIVGRLIGYGAVCSVLLLVMSIASYLFVVRGLSHSHELTQKDLERLPPKKGVPKEHIALVGIAGSGVTVGVPQPSEGWQGKTSYQSYHEHTLTLDNHGNGRTDAVMDHWHSVTRDDSGSEPKYIVGPPEGMLRARIPLYGKIRYLDRSGNEGNIGINVGYEWTYRSYFEGDTKCAAIWKFPGVNSSNFPESQFPDGIPMELNLRVFRTTKGDIVSPIPGTITIRNPESKLESEPFNFEAMEFLTDEKLIPRKLKGRYNKGPYQDLDLFQDFTSKGEIEVVIQCQERAQFFGAAQADVYLKAAEGNFALNVFKGFAANWFCVMILLAFGIMFSTFVSAPVAALATCGIFVLGYNRLFLLSVATGQTPGGGPVESTMRMFEQKNVTLPYDSSPGMVVVQALDFINNSVLWVIGTILPPFKEMSTADYVAYGYNISFDLLIAQFLTTMAYLLVICCLGYYCLRSREIAA